MERDELEAWLRLTLCPGVGNVAARALLQAFGSAPAIFAQTAASLEQVVSAKQARSLRTAPPELLELLESTLTWLQQQQEGGDPRRAVLTLGDPDYPQALLQTEDPPLLLYALGNARCARSELSSEPPPEWASAPAIDPTRCLAIVGTRSPTPQGLDTARRFARVAAECGWTVISGLARGIDGAAHAGALDAEVAHSPTVAVVGTGVDRVYPKAHLALAHRIAQRGLVLSEYPLGSAPVSAHFPRRNRLIAALSRGTLVVEAALRSGSLITARLSAEQGKDVFAVPGSIHALQSTGCHALIQQGAKLVTCPQDIFDEYPGQPERAISAPTPAPIAVDPADPSHCVLRAMGYDPTGLDTIQARTGMDTAPLQALLTQLELEGSVARLPGGRFQRQG
ncbi:DNA-processing protein DprA [Candidatus Symbiobacter mobilis]|uniref:DNA processing protein n=1 Tax=Candidatus Symbiobacter mobilis CR TaxID=946483 RepID=U5NCC1_9BURK|nr:DNA-processing protein DprA [Candidatus Symbiobacter mobilis]AGX87858.1 DNA processing protein [Candidatus Symbiobacter mobilis CR]